MKIYFSPFIIALVIHLFIVVSTGFLIDKPSENFISESKKLINVNFGSGGNTGGRAGDKIVKERNSSNSKTMKVNGPVLHSKLGSTVSINDFSGTGSGSEAKTATDDFSGHGSGVSFDQAVTSFKEPTYPRIALRRGIEGSLKIKIMITPEGLPQEIIILTSSGHEILDKAAIDAVKVWKFTSQEKPYFVFKTIIFQIKD